MYLSAWRVKTAEATFKISNKVIFSKCESKRDVPVSMEGNAGRGSFRDDCHQLLARQEQLPLMHIDQLHGGGGGEATRIAGFVLDAILTLLHSHQTCLAACTQNVK